MFWEFFRLLVAAENDRTPAVMDAEVCSRLQESIAPPPRAGIKRRRSSETTDPDALDCSGDSTSSSIIECFNFSDLYLPPPTPRMISSLDEVSEDESSWCPSAKRSAKQPTSSAPPSPVGSDVNKNRPALRPCNSLPTSLTTTTSSSSATSSSSTSSCSNQNSSPYSLTGTTSGLSLIHSSSASGQPSNSSTSYSCGQSSLFGELQSVVFHSLITSLES